MTKKLMLSDDEIAKMRARLQRATPGPWTSLIENPKTCVGSSFIQTAGEDIYLTGATVDDQEFIAHARTDVARLLDEVERLLRKLEG
jgi:tmRNA-binding protein